MPNGGPADFTATERYEDGIPTPLSKPPDGSATLPALLGLFDRLPGITLEGEIGRGGSGVVFRGREDVGGRTVAVKMLRRADPDEPRELARFVAEASNAFAVEHANVVRLLNYGEHQGRPYLVLEYCGGGSLAQRLRRDGPLPPAEAATILAAVADGIHAVHLAGIVHRDVKPGNILFGSGQWPVASGQQKPSSDRPLATGHWPLPKIADFGLAKRAADSTDLTQSRAVLGSPAYMSPEQARGGTKFVGPAADVWALGVVLFECLAGAVPFTGADPLAVLKAVAEHPHPPLRKLAPDVPRDLILVADKCLAKEPTDRYPTAAALAADLRAVAAGRPVAARGLGTGQRLLRWGRRHPIPAALTLGLVVSLLAGIVTSTYLAIQYRRQERATRAALERATAERRATWDALNALTDEALERLMARQPAITPADQKFLEGVIAQYERAVGRHAEAPDASRLLAHGQFRVARLQQRLGDADAAEAGYRAAADGFAAARLADPTDRHAAQGVADCRENLGWLLATSGRLAEAEGSVREAVAVRQALGDRVGVGKARGTLGLVFGLADRRAEAVAEYRAALADLLPTADSNRRQVVQVRVTLAGVLSRDPATFDAAEMEYAAAVSVYDKLLADDPTAARDRLAAVRARNDFGRLYARQGGWESAVTEYTAAVGVARPLVAELPGYADHQHELGRGLTLWAAAELATGQPVAARRRLEQAAAHHRRAALAKAADRVYRAGYAENRRLAGEAAVALGDHAAAAKAAGELAGLDGEPAPLLRRAARLARWDWKLTPAERAAAAARYVGPAGG